MEETHSKGQSMKKGRFFYEVIVAANEGGPRAEASMDVDTVRPHWCVKRRLGQPRSS